MGIPLKNNITAQMMFERVDKKLKPIEECMADEDGYDHEQLFIPEYQLPFWEACEMLQTIAISMNMGSPSDDYHDEYSTYEARWCRIYKEMTGANTCELF